MTIGNNGHFVFHPFSNTAVFHFPEGDFMKLKRNIAFLSVILLLSVLLTACSFTLVTPGGGSSGGSSDSSLDLGIAAINDCLSDNAYYDYDQDEMVTAALKAYVAALNDKYAAFYTYDEYLKLIAEGNGELHGIGIQVVANTVEIQGTEYQVYQIVNVYEDSPAMKSGVQVGDLLYAVRVGESMKTINELGFDELLGNIRGEDGTTTTIAVFRKTDDNYESVTISDIVRAKITTYSVTFRISETDPTVGIVRISNFDNTTADQLIQSIEDLQSKGIERFVFDLRNNPGGYVNSVCRVLSLFLSDGDTMLTAVDKSGKTTATYQVKAGSNTITKEDIGRFRGINATVLVNGNTASAAEIFTANMMYYKTATVIGTKTFGKGIMQTTFPLQKYGYNGFLKITTHAYRDPSGWCYHDIGITPDRVVELSKTAQNTNLYLLAEADDAQLQEALKLLLGSAD